MAEVAWTGREIFVLSLDGNATAVTRFDASGQALGSTPISATEIYGGLAWSMEHDAGVVILDSGVFALDTAGNIVAEVPFPEVTDAIDVMVTPQGFLAVRAVHEDPNTLESPSTMVYASLTAGQAAATWTAFEATGTYKLAHAVDARGRGEGFAFSSFPPGVPGFQPDEALLYDVVDGALTHRRTFQVPPSEGAVFALANANGRTLLVYGSSQPGASGQTINQLWLMDPASLASARQVDPVANFADGWFVHVGPDLVLLSGSIGAHEQLSAAQVDPRLPTYPLGPLLVLGKDGDLSDTARAVPIPRGFAAVWGERVFSGASYSNEVFLEIFDCCVTAPDSRALD
jgi:hypothetical protein